MVILIWVVAFTLLAGWSLAGLALRALLLHGPQVLEALPGWIQALPYPAVLEQWLPQWQEWAVLGATVAVHALGWLGAAGVVIVWVVWAVGTVLLVLLGLLLTWAVRRLPQPPGPPGPPAQANAASS